MKRRDLMKLGAVAAGAGAGVPGCAVPRLLSSMRGPDGGAAFNAMLDRQLAKVAQPGLLQRLVEATAGAAAGGARSPEAAARLAEQDAQFRQMLGTLLVTQGFRELPEETQLDPAVQERMWSHMEEVGDTVFAVTERLASLDAAQRDKVREVIGKRPDLPMEIGEAIDGHAAEAGISSGRRMQLRKMMSQAGFRLRHGDPGSIIDEYVEKVARVEESTSRHGDALRLAKQLGERSFWRYQHLLAIGAQPGAQPPVTTPAPQQQQPQPPQQPPPGQPGPTLGPPSVRPAPPEPQLEPPPPPRRPGERGLRVGGYMLGIGVVVFGVSAVLVEGGGAEVALFGLTAGAVLFAIGLITILISAIIMAAG